MERYLGASETFIHEYLAAFRRVRPVVVARRFEHLDRFPLPSGASLHRSPPLRFTPSWAWWAARRRLRGGDPHLEHLLVQHGARLVHAHYGPTACSLLETR